MAKVKVELTFPKELKDEPIIYRMGSDFKIIPNIIEASFSSDIGWAVLILEGEKQEIERLLEHLKQRQVTIDIRG